MTEIPQLRTEVLGNICWMRLRRLWLGSRLSLLSGSPVCAANEESQIQGFRVDSLRWPGCGWAADCP